jgi:hypothetical protein
MGVRDPSRPSVERGFGMHVRHGVPCECNAVNEDGAQFLDEEIIRH